MLPEERPGRRELSIPQQSPEKARQPGGRSGKKAIQIMVDASLVKYLAEKRSEMLSKLQELVEIESGSHDQAGVNRAGAFMGNELDRLGFTIETVSQPPAGNLIIARRSFAGKGRVLILGHLDTVWPTGTLKEWPFAVTGDGLATGPGIGDMKGGLIVALAAIEALAACRLVHLESIAFMLVPDEELGSTYSRSHIEAGGRKADWALVMEPGRPNGGVVTSRGAVGAFYLRARGRTAHCGGAFLEGVSAIRELAPKVEQIESLSTPEEGRILNVGIFRGGEARQVVPADAEMHIDLRAPDSEEADRLIARLREIALTPANPGVELSLTGGLTRPALSRTAGVIDLYQRALTIAREMKISLPEVHSRAGSDANLVVRQGTPALDGLGPVAWDVCSRRERIAVESLGQRALLLAQLMAGLKSDR